jgi:hypothetical protein
MKMLEDKKRGKKLKIKIMGRKKRLETFHPLPSIKYKQCKKKKKKN